MAQIHGQIESLKKLKYELKSCGIHRFNSIKEINDFLFNFQDEKEAIIKTQKEVLIKEINAINLRINENQDQYVRTKRNTQIELEVRIDTLKIDIDNLTSKVNKGLINKILYSLKLKKQIKLLDYYSLNVPHIIKTTIKGIQEKIENDKNQLKYINENNELIIKERSLPEIQKLNNVKKTIEELKPLIAGAVGENMVVKEIEKLPNEYILINDYNLKFNHPISNKNTNDKIYSIQIDHLLISKSGIFILETKNWSKKSIESLNLRSPVEQITRTSYALFLIINDAKIKLTEHHWGDKQIPIRNIIVMINEKPKEDFKYVKVKSLKELNKYITYFEPIFTENEVDRISKYLFSIQN